ncbi:MAG TPA: zf-HC2 domain-containing protein, partial [Armatimonadetes bacterium]|nr:zf-HC2 domain-containing protein [Armatimonadota bacterium]
MICHRFRRMMHEKLDGALTPEREEILMRHLSQCDKCAHHWQTLNASIRLLERAMQMDKHLQSIPTHAIEQRLQVQLHEYQARSARFSPQGKMRLCTLLSTRMRMSLLIVSSLIVILGFVFTVHWMYQSRQRQPADYNAGLVDTYAGGTSLPRHKTVHRDIAEPVANPLRFHIPTWNYKQTRRVGNALITLTVRRSGNRLEGHIIVEPLREDTAVAGGAPQPTLLQYPSASLTSPFLLTCADGSQRLPSRVLVSTRGNAKVFTVNWQGIGSKQFPASIFIAHAVPLVASGIRSTARFKSHRAGTKTTRVAVVKLDSVTRRVEFNQDGTQRRSLQVTLRLEPTGDAQISNILWELLTKAVDDTGRSLLPRYTK